jgi:hypothetical protein
MKRIRFVVGACCLLLVGCIPYDPWSAQEMYIQPLQMEAGVHDQEIADALRIIDAVAVAHGFVRSPYEAPALRVYDVPTEGIHLSVGLANGGKTLRIFFAQRGTTHRSKIARDTENDLRTELRIRFGNDRVMLD